MFILLKDIIVSPVAPITKSVPNTIVSFDVSYSGSASFIYLTTNDGAVSSYDANVTQPIRVSQSLINTGITSLEFSASPSSPNSIGVS
jgi:hypothetical protein